MQVPLLRLQCGVNSYDWGKKGSSSAAAKYAAATPAADFAIKADQPYAEVRLTWAVRERAGIQKTGACRLGTNTVMPPPHL